MRPGMFVACFFALCALSVPVLADDAGFAPPAGGGQEVIKAAPHRGPVFWFKGDPTFVDAISGFHGTPHGDVRIAPGVAGPAVWFDGVSSGVSFPDIYNLILSHSLSISVWVYVTAVPPGSNLAGQILFRGDDRVGLDPFTLDVTPDGQYQFHIEGDKGNASTSDAANLYYHCTLNQWTLLTGTFDADSGEIKLYVDGKKVAEDATATVPFGDLDVNSLPGIGIGDNQGFGKSEYHERFSGGIEDLQVFDLALSPAAIREIYSAAVRPAQLQALSSTLTPGSSTTLRLTLSTPAPAEGTVVTLNASPGLALSVPATVSVPAGATYVDFTVRAVAGASAGNTVLTASTGNGGSKDITLRVQQ